MSSKIWYHPYICEAVKLGIVTGFSDGTFRPNNPVTVLEALAITLRTYGLAPANGKPWYLPYQSFADTNNILETASYNIHTEMSRGKASDLILRTSEYSIKKEPLNHLSSGCLIPKGLTSGTKELTINGITRNYILSIPSGINTSHPAGLIIAIHGRTNSSAMVQNYMGLE